MARKRRKQEEWDVFLVPDGTLEEAEEAARCARRMVAGWILRNARNDIGKIGKSREIEDQT